MKCSSCGAEMAENVKFCTQCGTPAPKAPPVQPAPAPAQPVPPAQPARPVPPPIPPKYAKAYAPIPPENKPLSPWAYYGLQLLFSIPLVGFICLIVFSLDDGNINRRNFARSYWCSLIISLVVLIVVIVLLLITGLGATILSEIENIPL